MERVQRIAKITDFTWEIELGKVTWPDTGYDLLQYVKSGKINYEKIKSDIHHPDDLEKITRWLYDSISSEENELPPLEYRLIRKDGTTIYVRTIGRIERKEGKAVKIFGISQDITDHKRTEEVHTKLEEQYRQSQKLESIGRLAGGIAHDFSNMISVILGLTEIVMNNVDSSQTIYQDLQEIKKAAERLGNLTRQLLAFAQKQVVSPKVIDLNNTVQELLKMLRQLINEDVELDWIPGNDLWPVKMDLSQIDQLLANLCVNARDAITCRGKITIKTENYHLDESVSPQYPDSFPGDYVRLVVSDNGCGMEKDIISQIFDPFFTTKTNGEGTGIGLSTVYGIVKQNNGFINVSSEPGEGSTFEIYLPRYCGKTGQGLTEECINIQGSQGHETILLLDDEPSLVKICSKFLQETSYQILFAESPDQAVELAEKHDGEIHLLITDVVMPNMNGFDLSNQLQSRYPAIKILFMSGYPQNTIDHYGVLEEGVHFIQKPFTPKALLDKIQEVLDS